MNKISSEPPALWDVPDIFVLLLMPIALLLVVVTLFSGLIYKDQRSS